MKKILASLALLALLVSGGAFAQEAQIGGKPISAWPIPASGSVNISTGDKGVFTRGGVSYGLTAGWGANCGSSAWVNSINPQGVGVCTQPYFSQIAGFLNPNQIGGLFTNGQIMIGSTATGGLVSNTITAGTGVAIINGPGTITISAGALPASVELGTAAAYSNPARIGDATTGLFSPAAATVAVAAAGVQEVTVNGTGLGIGTAAPENALEIGGGLLGTFTGSRIAVSNAVANSGVDIGQASGYHGYVNWVYNATAANAYMSVGVAGGTNPLILEDAGGDVGIGTTNPGALFTVGSNAFEVNSSGTVLAGTWQGTPIGTAYMTGVLRVANGGTAASSASGTTLDNITGFASTGFLTRTGAGTYAFQSTTNGITLGNVAQIATNTILGNTGSGTANVAAISVSGCSAAGDALIWTTNTGPGCNTSITAAAVPASGLTGSTLASGVTGSSLTGVGTISSGTWQGTAIGTAYMAGNGGITFGSTVTYLGGTVTNLNAVNVGPTTAGTGAFTTLSASGAVSGSGFTNYLASPPPIGTTAPAAISATTLAASSTVSGTGFTNYFASPPALGGTAAAAVTGTAIVANTSVGIATATLGTNAKLAVNGGVTVGTYAATDVAAPTNGLIVSGNVGIGTASPAATNIFQIGSTPYVAVGTAGGVVVGTATGGNQGAGTLNATALYVNGSAVGSGSGNVVNTGTPTNGQMAMWTNATTIQGVAPSIYGGSYLLVGGGAAGGGVVGGQSVSGAGAGGEVLPGVTYFVPGQTLTVTVAAGGTFNSTTQGANGGVSSINGPQGLISTVAVGGGGANAAGSAGYNGGGGGVGGAGGVGTNFSGGPSTSGNNGGGGAGNAGAGITGTTNTGGAGGNGTANSITGSSLTYGCGGGGGGNNSGGPGTAGCAGGSTGAWNVPATTPTANTGNGGGGDGYTGSVAAAGASGASGVVILSIPTVFYSGTTTGSPTITTSGANTIIKFTSSGTYTE
jgi:hypothetical protein